MEAISRTKESPCGSIPVPGVSRDGWMVFDHTILAGRGGVEPLDQFDRTGVHRLAGIN